MRKTILIISNLKIAGLKAYSSENFTGCVVFLQISNRTKYGCLSGSKAESEKTSPQFNSLHAMHTTLGIFRSPVRMKQEGMFESFYFPLNKCVACRSQPKKKKKSRARTLNTYIY